jgi:hypothetical protein
LLENDDFKNEFIQRHALYANTIFHPDRLIPIIDSLQANIAAEIPRHISRWGGQKVPNPESWISPTFRSVRQWESNVQVMRSFAKLRPRYAMLQMIKHFHLSGTCMLSFSMNIPHAGIIEIESRPVPDGFSGIFYIKIPFSLSAESMNGYSFSHWECGGDTLATTAKFEYMPDGDRSLVAHFLYTGNSAEHKIVINEINYNAAADFDTEDWIEVYNHGGAAIDLGGWRFMDSHSDHVYIIPGPTLLRDGGFLVLCQDIQSFRFQFPDVKNCIGNFDFGLDGTSDVLRLYNKNGALIDSVAYQSASPWPHAADGFGPTLELLNPDSDNTISHNWSFSQGHGTPGRPNSSITANGKPGRDDPVTLYSLLQNYPNPFNAETIIPYSLQNSGKVDLTVYDLLGRKVKVLVDDSREPGVYKISWRPEGLASGVYMVRLIAGSYTGVRKVIYLK